LELTQGPLHLVRQAQHLLGIVLHDLASFGQEDAFTHPFEQQDTQLLLQGVHVVADRRLTDVEDLPGGAREAAGRRHGMEDL
jgi:hypothetical protein